jgi:hypothetical protein
VYFTLSDIGSMDNAEKTMEYRIDSNTSLPFADTNVIEYYNYSSDKGYQTHA